jgi:hypothetical protein
VALAFLTGCGSGASPSSGAGARATDSKEVAHDRSQGPVTSAASPRSESPVLDDNGLPVQPPPQQPPGPFLCARDPIAFDLSLLFPAPETPDGFIQAWGEVRARTEIPGFVVVYSGVSKGPSIIVRVGAVRQATAGAFGFQRLLPPSDPVAMGLYPDDPFHFRSFNSRGDFVTALGKRRERDGFVVSKVLVDGRLDRGCEYLNDVTVELTLPGGRNMGQWFGGRTIDEALGPVNIDTDRDGKPDSWRVKLTGPSLTAMDFKL